MGNAHGEGEIITPPNTLRKKVGGRMGPASEAMIATAEAAIADLSDNFDQWMKDEVGKLEAARKTVIAEGLDGDAGQRLFNAAHDLKGLGTTYGYPLVSEIADSLCTITLEKDVRAKAPMKLVNAHVDSIRAIVNGQIKTAQHATGQSLARELGQRAKEFLASV